MKTLASITVALSDGSTFDVDLEKDCALFWNKEGWDVLVDYYEKVQKDPKKAKEVRTRTCPKAKPKGGKSVAKESVPSDDAVIALKEPHCEPTQWP